MTPADVKWSYEYPFAQPFSPFLSYASSQFSSILAHEIFEADDDFSKRTVGTGPYQLDVGATKNGSQRVFQKNPGYFRQGLPYIDRIVWLVLPDDATQTAAFQAGQSDLLDYFGLAAQAALASSGYVPRVCLPEDVTYGRAFAGRCTRFTGDARQ